MEEQLSIIDLNGPNHDVAEEMVFFPMEIVLPEDGHDLESLDLQGLVTA